MRGYVNGYEDITNTAFFGSINTTNHMFAIGRMGSYAGLYLNGKISQTKIYNTALSEDNIYQNYLATKGRYGL
jgi:hypothetical protein